LENIKKEDERKKYLKNGLRILARIIVREELKKQSKRVEQTGTYSIEDETLPEHKIIYTNKKRREKKDYIRLG
jgi:hypothetical protein